VTEAEGARVIIEYKSLKLLPNFYTNSSTTE